MIESLLVANRGEIARRVIRTARRLGWQTVAIQVGARVPLIVAIDQEGGPVTRLTEGCTNIGRNLTDTRGLIHSFRDARETMLQLFNDLRSMLGQRCLDWEIVFYCGSSVQGTYGSTQLCWSSPKTGYSTWSSR